jgi:multiple sugar transport system substrate-binding protein
MGSYCGTGAWIDLTPLIARDKVDISRIPKPVRDYTQFQGKRCALPVLADVYGLYYNKAMFAKAGISSPPKTVSELTADAKKLTVKNPDGSIKVAGFVPNMTFYENAAAHFAPLWGAQWDQNGKSSIGTDPHWASMLMWDKQLIDFYGYNNLVKFESGAGQEFSSSNAFETGKLAMELDGEYRTAFLTAEHPELKYGTAPAPVDDAQAALYGGGYVTGNTLGIPKGAANAAAAWELAKYLALDNRAITKLANGLGNVPTTTTALKDPALKSNPQFETFLKIFTDSHTATNPNTAIGTANQELFQNFISRWQSGTVPAAGLAAGLKGVDAQIDAQVQNSTVGKAP